MAGYVRPVQKSPIREIFMAWAQETAWARNAVADDEEDGYDRSRCVLRFMLWEVQFKTAIDRLWKCIDMLICAPEGRALLQTLHIAVESMPPFFIKICSYQGVCLRRQPGCLRHTRYLWYDPSNYAYAQVWYLLVRYCWFIDKKKTGADNPARVDWCNARSPFATRMLGIHTRTCERWPVVSEATHYERLGDLLELVLSRCYCDGASRLDGLLHMISDIVFWVRNIYHAAWFNQLTQPCKRIPAWKWADAIQYIHQLQRLNIVQCRGREQVYSPEEEAFDKWASNVGWCYRRH